MELNPNHPVTQAMHGSWHKVLGIAMFKLGMTEIVITAEDVTSTLEGLSLVAFDLPDGLHIMLVDGETARKLASEHGGLPH